MIKPAQSNQVQLDFFRIINEIKDATEITDEEPVPEVVATTGEPKNEKGYQTTARDDSSGGSGVGGSDEGSWAEEGQKDGQGGVPDGYAQESSEEQARHEDGDLLPPAGGGVIETRGEAGGGTDDLGRDEGVRVGEGMAQHVTPSQDQADDAQRLEAVAKGRRIRQLRNITPPTEVRPPSKKFIKFDKEHFEKNAAKSHKYGLTPEIRERSVQGLKSCLQGESDPKEIADAMFVTSEALRFVKNETIEEIAAGLGISKENAAPSLWEPSGMGRELAQAAKEIAKRSLPDQARVLITEPKCAAEVIEFGEENLKRLQVTIQTKQPWKAEVIRKLIPSVNVTVGEVEDAIPRDGYYDAIIKGSAARKGSQTIESGILLKALVPGSGLLIASKLEDSNTLCGMKVEEATYILQNAEWIGGIRDARGIERFLMMVLCRRKEPISATEAFKEIQKKYNIDPSHGEKTQIGILENIARSETLNELIELCPNRPLTRGVVMMNTGGLAKHIPEGCLGVIETEEGIMPVQNKGGYEYHIYGENAFESERLRGLAELAAGLRELRWRCQDVDVEAYEETQRVLREKYEEFIKTFGPVAKGKNAEILNSTGDWINVIASESPGMNGGPAGWLIRKHRGIKREEGEITLDQALTHSLRTYGYVDLDFMGGLLEQDPMIVRESLGERVMLDPHSMHLHIRSVVLSGDVVSSLEKAEVALAEVEQQLRSISQENSALTGEGVGSEGIDKNLNDLVMKQEELKTVVEALREVTPSPVPLEDIAIKLSDKAVPIKAIEEFLKDSLRISGVKVIEHANGEREVDYPSSLKERNSKLNEWSTKEYKGKQLIRIALTRGTVTHTRKAGETVQEELAGQEEKANVVDDKELARMEANEVIGRINKEFRDWLLSPAQREIAEEFHKEWNRQRNRFRPMEVPVSICDLDGLDPEYVPRPYQLRAASKAILNNRGLFFHFPGAGKTLTAAIVANTHFNSGAKTRLLYLAPSSTLEGLKAEMSSYFPALADKIRILSPGDFRGEKGAETLRQTVEMPYVLDMMSYDTFKTIAGNRIQLEKRKNKLESELLGLETQLDGLKKEGKRPEYQQLIEGEIKSLRQSLESVRQEIGSLPGITLTEMGYEGVIADEADELRNLRSTASARGATMSGNKLTESFKAWLEQEQARDPRFATILMTGTLMGRTITEYYTYQRYVQEEALRRQGISNLTDWINAYGTVKTSLSINLEGKVSGKDVVSVANYRELRNMLDHIVDVVTESDIVGSKSLPKYRGGGQKIITAQKTAAQAEFYVDAMRRLQKIKEGTVDPKVDNVLKVFGECVAASLGGKMVGMPDEVDPESKLGMATLEILKEFIRSGGNGTQLVFLDRFARYEEKGGKRVRQYDALEELQSLLIAGGIPKEKILRIHDVPDRRWQRELDKIKRGEYSVVLTSRGLIGRGVNIQDHIIGDIHLDVPWNPNELLQSLRRARRPGNQNSVIFSGMFVTEGSAERLLVEANRSKIAVENDFWRNTAGRAFQSMAQDMEPRLMEVEAEILGGDNRLLELAKLEAQWKILEAAVNRENELKKVLPIRIKYLQDTMDALNKRIEEHAAIVDAIREFREERQKAEQVEATAKAEPKENALPSTPDVGESQQSKEEHLGKGEIAAWGVEIAGRAFEGDREALGMELQKAMIHATRHLPKSQKNQYVSLGSVCGGRIKIMGIKGGRNQLIEGDDIVLTMDENNPENALVRVFLATPPEFIGKKIINSLKGVHLEISNLKGRSQGLRDELESAQEVLAKCGDSSKKAEEAKLRRDELLEDLRKNPPNLEAAKANVIPRTPAESKKAMEEAIAPLREQVNEIVERQKQEYVAKLNERMRKALEANLTRGGVDLEGSRSLGAHPERAI